MGKNGVQRMSLLGLATVLVLALAPGCARTSSRQLKVVVTTSLLGSLVERLGGSRVELTVITAPAACPGEFDVTPGQVKATSQAALFLKHGWPGEAFTEGLLKAANNPKLKVVTIELPGNWMTPPIQADGVKAVAQALAEVDPENGDLYRKNAQPLLDIIQRKGEEMRTKLQAAETGKVSVLCSDQQAGFVTWAGFQVAGTYGRPADLTPEKVRELVAKGREVKVALVVDNLQSGPQAGAQMAQELGAVQVTLSNFPGGFEGTETWEKAIERNIELLLEALGRARGR